MKTMTCKQLGGACDQAFHANTFNEIAEMSKNHAMQMFQEGDKPHLEAMNTMKELMTDPNALATWMEEKEALFNSLSDTK